MEHGPVQLSIPDLVPTALVRVELLLAPEGELVVAYCERRGPGSELLEYLAFPHSSKGLPERVIDRSTQWLRDTWLEYGSPFPASH